MKKTNERGFTKKGEPVPPQRPRFLNTIKCTCSKRIPKYADAPYVEIVSSEFAGNAWEGRIRLAKPCGRCGKLLAEWFGDLRFEIAESHICRRDRPKVVAEIAEVEPFKIVAKEDKYGKPQKYQYPRTWWGCNIIFNAECFGCGEEWQEKAQIRAQAIQFIPIDLTTEQ